MRPRAHTQPRLAEVHLRRLAHLATRYGVSMTDLLNLIVATALEDLEQAPARGDDGHTPSRAHDRHRRTCEVTIRQHRQRDTGHD